MLRSSFLVVCAALLAPVCVAQTKLEATDIVNEPFSQDFASGGKLRLRVRSGEIHVIGTDQDKITRTMTSRSRSASRQTPTSTHASPPARSMWKTSRTTRTSRSTPAT